MSSLLPFKLFCQRKRFSIEGYIKKFPDSTFIDFYDFLVSREVQPPEEEEFLKIKGTLKLQEKKLDTPEDFGQVKIKEDIDKQKSVSPLRKKRRTKNKVDNNN